MRALLCVAALVGSVISASCPSGYDWKENKWCVKLHIFETNMVWNDEIPRSRVNCAADGATLPIIHSTDDNDRFTRIAFSYGSGNIYLALDLICDQATHRLRWIDGSEVNYRGPNNLDNTFDCMKDDHTFISRVQKKDWDWINAYKDHTMTVLCVRDPIQPTTVAPTTRLTTTPKPTCPPCPTVTSTTPKLTTTTSPATTAQPLSEQCGDYESMTSPADGKSPCVKLYTDPLSWEIAQKRCMADFGSLITINSADENKFLWRAAVSNNILGGIHIGAHQSTEDPNVWTWVDGEVPFDGKTYDNFIGSFPIAGAGECASMLTESSSALWINEDCNTNNLAFFCRREDYFKLPKTCPKAAPAAGEDIIPPGFPISDIPCDYVMFVAAEKLVEIEIFALVTDGNRDVFEIFEGSSGSNLIASLTGSILAPAKIRTAKSNVARVNWQPNGSGDSRGFRIRYYEVDP